MNSVVLLLIALGVFATGYRFYARFLATRVIPLDPDRATPAVRLEDGRDYVPTHRWVTFFYHFATISGSGVLVGPTLAAQYGWLPCLLWILVATCLAGGMHDFVILAASVRHEGKSLAQIALAEVGPVTGAAVMVAILFLVTTAMAGLGLGAVAALEHNAWGTFSVAMTIPIALLLAAYLRWIRPGRIAEASLLGMGLLLVALFIGPVVRDSGLGAGFDLSRQSLTILLAIYAFIAAVLPVGVLVRPRDYLSAYIKAGTVLLLMLGIFLVRPSLHLPPVTSYVAGGGPVVPGALWPFLFIIITCGAISLLRLEQQRHSGAGVPVHHHHLRGHLRLARPLLLRGDPQAHRQRTGHSARGLRRLAAGEFLCGSGAGAGGDIAARRLFRH